MEKEELLSLAGVVALLVVGDADASEEDELSEPVSDGVVAVSYTHLTLPTILRV